VIASPARATPALAAAADLWRWLGAELAAMLPPRLRAALAPPPAMLLAEVTDDGFRFTRHQRGRAVPLAGAPAAAGLPVWLAMPESVALVHRIDWPAMPEADLRRALPLDLDRQTPCRAEVLWWDVEPIARDAVRRRLTLDLAVVPAAEVMAAQARLQALHGVLPARTCLATAGGVPRFDLRPAAAMASKRAPPALLPRTLRGRLLLLCALLGLANLALHASATTARRERLDTAVRDARLRAQRVEMLRMQVAERRQLRDELVTRRADIALLGVLDQLTRLLPDDAWLDSVEVRGASVYVTGHAPMAASLVARIETSPMFADAQFRSPVTPDRARGRERFDMAIRLRDATPDAPRRSVTPDAPERGAAPDATRRPR